MRHAPHASDFVLTGACGRVEVRKRYSINRYVDHLDYMGIGAVHLAVLDVAVIACVFLNYFATQVALQPWFAARLQGYTKLKVYASPSQPGCRAAAPFCAMRCLERRPTGF